MVQTINLSKKSILYYKNSDKKPFTCNMSSTVHGPQYVLNAKRIE